MISLLNSKDSKELDNYTIRESRISRDKLIDNAGKSIAYHIIEKTSNPFKKKILCVAGLGDNGLDAIVCSSYLNKNKVSTDLLVIEPKKVNSKYLNLYVKNKYFLFTDDIKFNQYDLVVDGIFGTGLNRPIESMYLAVAKKLSSCKSILSIDIPTGIYADSGASSNITLKANHTVTFSYPKVGHYLSDGYSARGDLFIYDIGHAQYKGEEDIYLLNSSDISKIHRSADIQVDKYQKGKVLSISGSLNYTGASFLSSSACLKAGTGILKNIYPRSLFNEMISNKESIDIPLEDSKLGYLSNSNFDDINLLYDWADALLIGPGLSSKVDSLKLIQKILSTYQRRCVIDATALSAIDYRKDGFSKIPEKSILTPHYGEFSRLIGVSRADIKNNTIEILNEVSPILENRILILKGPNTIILDGNYQKYLIEDGTSLLATAGTGDVLSGIITSYLASGYSLKDASLLGVYVHAKASNLLRNKGLENMIASEIIDLIPLVQNKIHQKNV